MRGAEGKHSLGMVRQGHRGQAQLLGTVGWINRAQDEQEVQLRSGADGRGSAEEQLPGEGALAQAVQAGKGGGPACSGCSCTPCLGPQPQKPPGQTLLGTLHMLCSL